MVVKMFNSMTVGTTVGFLVLLATLYNLRSRGMLSHYSGEVALDENENLAPNNAGSGQTVTTTVTVTATAASAAETANRPSFLEIARLWGTDKVTVHHYNYMYTKYLEPIRDQPLKMLEIGLGCDMEYGPGKSFYTWKEYFPHVDLYYIEYDKECVERWSTNMHGVKVFAGSQEDEDFLDSFINTSGGGFDIIIDDGGHTMNQQIVSLEKLFPIVKPGGFYFCEDLATSYFEDYGATVGVKTMMMYIQELLHDLNYKLGGAPEVSHVVGKEMRSVECGEEICAFTKKKLESTKIVV